MSALSVPPDPYKFFVQNRELFLLFFALSQGAVHSFQRLFIMVG
jgi:hypothetical protein